MRREIHSMVELRRYALDNGGIEGVVVQGVDLSDGDDLVRTHPAAGAVFLGCKLSDAAISHIVSTGGLLFPEIPELPYHPYRSALYTVDELMDGYVRGDAGSFAETLDQAIFRHFDELRKQHTPIIAALSQRLHDHAIDDALDDLLGDPERARKVVAIMGGHAMKRTDPEYRDVAAISLSLCRRDPSILMASGGGPGAMEATHLGAWMAPHGEDALDAALEVLRAAPDYKHEGWLDTAFEVREAYPGPAESLAIPTWFYGHEPSNLFATHIAKYFSNSLREDGLLAIARHGVVYAPGSAGTIQEVFMDAAQNHYGTFGVVSPMVFLGREYWSRTKPVYPLLVELARGRQYARQLAASDDVSEVVEFLLDHPPVPYGG